MRQPHLDLQLPGTAPVVLAALRCTDCTSHPITVYAFGRGETADHAYCSIACARRDGWPWLTPERPAHARKPHAAR